MLRLIPGVWSNRPIVPGPERDEVCMDEYFVGAGTLPTQIIHLQEEVEDDIPIARLNYNGEYIRILGRIHYWIIVKISTGSSKS